MLFPVPTLLIVDPTRAWGPALQHRLLKDHPHVRLVTSLEDAIEFARCEPSAVAVLECLDDFVTRNFCKAISRLGVQVLCRCNPIDADPAGPESGETI
jgi:hypothetical protein